MKPQFKALLLSLAALSSGCYNRGRQEVHGMLTVDHGGVLTLRDKDGDSVDFDSGGMLLDYQDRGWSRDSALFILRAETDRSHGALLEFPCTDFTSSADFHVPARDSKQAYDIDGNRSTEHLGSHEYQDTEGCTAPGVCCQMATRIVSNGRGGTTTESYADCGFHGACPGNQDVLMRQDDYVDHYLIEFVPQSSVDGAHFRGDGPPYSTRTKIRNLSGCRT